MCILMGNFYHSSANELRSSSHKGDNSQINILNFNQFLITAKKSTNLIWLHVIFYYIQISIVHITETASELQARIAYWKYKSGMQFERRTWNKPSSFTELSHNKFRRSWLREISAVRSVENVHITIFQTSPTKHKSKCKQNLTTLSQLTLRLLSC